MHYFADSIAELLEELARLPGVGPKTAERLAFHLLERPREEVYTLARAMVRAHDSIKHCSICRSLTDTDPCKICTDPQRDKSLLCIVEDVRDLVALEKAGTYKGHYHVLGGLISPMRGVGPEKLGLDHLLNKIKKGDVKEVIIAVSSVMDGETTALYLAKIIKPYGVKLTRIAQGLPVGSDLEYADQLTLSRAFQGRREM